MSKEIIEFEREAILRKVLKIPDLRYKSGYRKREVLAENRVFLPDGIDGMRIAQSHIHKGKTFTQTDAIADVSIILVNREIQL